MSLQNPSIADRSPGRRLPASAHLSSRGPPITKRARNLTLLDKTSPRPRLTKEPTLRYDGPIIDAHTHLWDLSMEKHPWLSPTGHFGPTGQLDGLKGRDYSVEQYRADVAETPVIASVHVEALWDAADDPVNETRWLETLDGGAFASRYVAAAAFGMAATEARLRAQAAFARVRGIRQTIAWTPDPDRRMAKDPDITQSPGWRAAVPLLLDLDLHLELLLYPYQAGNVVQLARDFPDLIVVVNHIGSPIEQDPAGLERWHASLSQMAACDNVLIKLSAAAAYPDERSVEAMRSMVDPVIDAFGPGRTIWGSDFPVGTLVGWSYADYLSAYRSLLDRYSVDEQRAILFGGANKLYRFGL